MRILIGERDPHFRRMLEHMLTSWEYQAIACTSGPEALALLESNHAPEVALLDSAMPVMDGFQLCRKIRESPGPLARIYVVMLLRRSITIRDVFAASLDAGADDYICKPFDPEELRARLRVGTQVIALRRDLGALERELEATSLRVQELQTFPIQTPELSQTPKPEVRATGFLEFPATREPDEAAIAAQAGLAAR